MAPANNSKKTPAHIARMIRKTGTPDQIRQLEEEEAAGRPERLQAEIDYYHKVMATKKAPDADEAISAMRFIINKLNAKTTAARPPGIDYDKAKVIFWNSYRQLIYHETRLEITRLEPADAEAIKNFVHWLIRSNKGAWDPDKSLFLWGGLGTGKTTIAMAGHLVAAYFRANYSWEKVYYNFRSLDELFLQTYTTQSLAAIGDLATGGWCLDELREEHFKYRHYGNEVSMLADVLTARHNNWKRTGDRTIITSNMNPKSLDILGDRIYDRIRQEYQAIELTGSNKRHPVTRLKATRK